MYSSTLPSTSALDGGGWLKPGPGRFTSGKDPVPFVQKAGWAPGPVWTGEENVAPTGIRSPDRPVRSVIAIPTELSQPLMTMMMIIITIIIYTNFCLTNFFFSQYVSTS